MEIVKVVELTDEELHKDTLRGIFYDGNILGYAYTYDLLIDGDEILSTDRDEANKTTKITFRRKRDL